MPNRFDDAEHSVVAFYGISATEGVLGSLYSKALLWSDHYHCPFHQIGIGGNRLFDFKRMRKKLEVSGFSAIPSLEVHCISPGAKDRLESSDLVVSVSRERRQCTVNFRSSVLGLESTGFRGISKELITLLAPAYGVGFRRIQALGPSYFAAGLNFGDVSPVEEAQVISWRECTWGELFLHGFLGGVFPWNFLARAQLGARVGNLTLEEWIGEQPRRGELQGVSPDITMWTLRDQDVLNVQTALWKAGIVFDYGRDVVAKMDEYNLSHNDILDHLRTGKPLAQGPRLAPLKGKEVLGIVLQSFGYESPEELQILKVEGKGRVRGLSKEEVGNALTKKKRIPKTGQS
jgi:hypothetical protein